jgi:alpha-L-rhamnosidase
MKTGLLRSLPLILAFAAQTAGLAALVPTDLRCEYLRNPLGIDATAPRLSWILESTSPDARGESQSAWQVLVADNLTALRADQGTLWDSGRVASDQTLQVAYAGKGLPSEQVCFWKVRVWDQDGRVSDWSAPAQWSMGLLQPDDWKGQWIGRDEVEQQPKPVTGTWIWYPEGDPTTTAPVGTRYFRRGFNLSGASPVKSAQLIMTADNSFEVFVNGDKVGVGSSFKTIYEFDIAERLRVGLNVIAVAAGNAGDNANPAGLLANLEVMFANGGRFRIRTDADWRAGRDAADGWRELVFNENGWQPAKVLGAAGMGPWGELRKSEQRRNVARYLRREFAVSKPVKRATAWFSGLGLSEMHLNGQKVGDHELSPGLTEYTKRVFYVTHDVTDLLQPGANAIGVILGNGRYFAPRLEEPTATRTYGYPKLLFQMRVEYTDGSSDLLVSDDSWHLTTDGPIQGNCEYDGEEYDARRDMPGWSRPGFQDLLEASPSSEGLSRKWEKVQLVEAPGGVLSAQMMEPIRVTEVLRPVAINQPEPGLFIFDLGQNMVGWPRLHVTGPRGTRITLRHAETLKPDGTLYLDNIRGAKVTDTYTLRGGDAETYEPTFTYHGYRYVELRGFPGQPDLTTLEGCVVNDDLERTGQWLCSNPLLNRIHRNVYWGVRGNYRSLPTDCPQRDERQGWLGDRSAESRGEVYLHDIAALYAKWVQDFEDGQKPNGSVSDVNPPYWPLFSDNITWPSSTVIIPGHLHEQYADVRIVARHYDSMKRWMDHMAGFMKDGLMPRDNYGDWCVPPEDPKSIHSQDPARKTSPVVLGTTYYQHCCRLMARYARLIGREADARAFEDQADALQAAFNEKLYDPAKGWYDNGSQTSCVLPLAFGMVPDDVESRVFGRLIDKITNESLNHVGTGLIGGQYLMRTLTAGGRADLAYTLASNRTYPSWGYMIDKGATTIWELWNGDTADPAMNSGNHVMLVGDLIIWFYENLAGIKGDPAHPGFGRLVMRPEIVGDLTFVQASFRSPRGMIRSYWRRSGDRLDWHVTVPPNVTAFLQVPATSDTEVQEGGRTAGQQPGIRFLGWADGRAHFDIGSGEYRFTSRLR